MYAFSESESNLGRGDDVFDLGDAGERSPDGVAIVVLVDKLARIWSQRLHLDVVFCRI